MKMLLGLAAAAAAAYLLKTEKGKTILADLKRQAGTLTENFSGKTGDLFNRGSQQLAQTKDQATNLL